METSLLIPVSDSGLGGETRSQGNGDPASDTTTGASFGQVLTKMNAASNTDGEEADPLSQSLQQDEDQQELALVIVQAALAAQVLAVPLTAGDSPRPSTGEGDLVPADGAPHPPAGQDTVVAPSPLGSQAEPAATGLALPLSAPGAPAGSDKDIPPEGGIPPGDGQTVARPRGQDARGTEQIAIQADVRLAAAGKQGQAGGEQAGAASADAERDQAWLNGPSRADGSVPPPVQQGGGSVTPKPGKDSARPSDAIAPAVAARPTMDVGSDHGGASLAAQGDGGQGAGRQAGEQRLSEQVHQASAGGVREGKDLGKEGRGQEAAQSFAGIERQIAGLGPNSNQEAKSTPPVPPAHPVVPPADETASPPASRSVSLEVQPPDMGRVQLRVTVAEQTVHAHVTTEQVEVKNFLVANQARLETGLQAHGMDIGSFQVDVDAHGRQLDTGWGTGSGREGQALPRGEQGAGSGSDSAHDQRTDASAAGAREPGLLSLFA